MMKMCLEHDYPSKGEVEAAYPEAEVVKKVEGAWLVFSSVEEYETWKRQV